MLFHPVSRCLLLFIGPNGTKAIDSLFIITPRYCIRKRQRKNVNNSNYAHTKVSLECGILIVNTIPQKVIIFVPWISVDIARVFPWKTKISPTDDLAFFDAPGRLAGIIDAVHVSVAFTWELDRAKRLADAWDKIAPVNIGGTATGEAGGDFTPGIYLQPGWLQRSRGQLAGMFGYHQRHERRDLPV